MNKPKLLLLDADVIVFAHQFGVWAGLVSAYEVHVPATVIEEAKFFISKDGRKSIDLKADEAAGRIRRLETTATRIFETFKDFEPTFLAALHDGEKEAIAILMTEAESGLVFCTGDIIAVQSVGMLGLCESCLSFEEVLRLAGLLKLVSGLGPPLRKSTTEFHLEKGKTRRTTGECFTKSPLSR
ncbi:MAG: hypothetical protein LAN62_03475 [Acidobacteriia bacterium]|nr:hypothetical protein [Terriglobia bacterium]